MRSYLIYYNEIGLKRGNRRRFEVQLIRNIYRGTRGLGVTAVKRMYGRFRLDQNDSGDAMALEARLGRIYGIAHFDPVLIFPDRDLDRVRSQLDSWAEGGGFSSFAVRTRRVDKLFPARSQDLNIEFGARIQSRSGARVDLTKPERTFHVLILGEAIYLHHAQIRGPMGLPVGMSGRVAVLLSGGIDSPVAAERMMRRGCSVRFVHFHSSPFTDRSSIAKAVELAEMLCRHRLQTTLSLVPLGLLQRKIVAEAPSAYRVILYRRFMLRLAERVARRKKCLALATGDAVGQVASQTVENLCALDNTVSMPIFRPLLTFDKQEIVNEAQRIGTFEVSIEPDSDCCGYLLPRDPVLRARIDELERIEGQLDCQAEIEQIIAGIEEVKVGVPDPDEKETPCASA